MLKRHGHIILILICLFSSNLFGQDKFELNNIVNDSLIKKYRIKQVTENWFLDSIQTLPENTTVEKYNERGLKIEGVHLNYLYHKFIDAYEYNLKKDIIIKTTYYYDWNPYRERRKGDTIVGKNVTKYSISAGRKFQSKLTLDDKCRLIERIDTVKYGYKITYYACDNNDKLVERQHYISYYSESPYLLGGDSLYYSLNGQLIREVNCSNVKISQDNLGFDRNVITTYRYNQAGLVVEKEKLTQDQSHKNSTVKSTLYRYEYEFY